MSPRRRSDLTVAVTEMNGVRALRLSGEFDLAAVEQFESRVNAEPATEVTLVDLREVRFIDSSGLRALISADLRLRAERRRLVVVKSAGQVEEILNLTGLADRLELADEVPAELGASGRG